MSSQLKKAAAHRLYLAMNPRHVFWEKSREGKPLEQFDWMRRLGSWNAPTKQRRLWRQEARMVLNRLARQAPDEFQPFPDRRISSIYDWY
jgi:hypothetical protein